MCIRLKTQAEYRQQRLKENSTSVAVPEAQPDSARPAMRDAIATTMTNPAGAMMTAAHLPLLVVEDTMTETLLARHETIAVGVGVEADAAAPRKIDRPVEASRARRL